MRRIRSLTVLMVFSAATSILAQAPTSVIHGSIPGDSFGRSVAGAGDVDADGVNDVAIGAPNDGAGRVRVLSGRDGTVLMDFAPAQNGGNCRVGERVDGVGDVDGDGFDDVAASASFIEVQTGVFAKAVVRSGADGTALLFLGQANTPDFTPASVAGVGDVDGDGIPDVLLGKPSFVTGGVATVHSGCDGSVIHTVTSPFGTFGLTVSAAGDVNQDGRADFIVGAPEATIGTDVLAGCAVVYSGLDGSVIRTHIGNAFDRLGSSATALGDLSGDGLEDYAVGAATLTIGHATVYSASSGLPLLILSGTVGERFGASIAAAGDWNGDGVDDIAVGAPEASPSGTAFAGRVCVFSGLNGSVLANFVGQDGDLLGWSVSAVDGGRDSTCGAGLLVGVPDNFQPGEVGEVQIWETTPPVPLPGSGGDLIIETIADGDCAGIHDTTVTAGEAFSLSMRSPGATHLGDPSFFAAQYLPGGVLPPPTGVADLYLNPNAGGAFFPSNGGMLVPLPAGGIASAGIAQPLLAGLEFLVQGGVVTVLVPGFVVFTDGNLLRFD